ncbi:hypothetical protein ZEAMMB73_Zm00001d050926 [Zea mays]|uniref:Uncharacterized protein n=1 Tax=Zea mays TaxID=4577 RepID=A0A1D6Q3X5_MAIZE|nr:hypothetical protein ZEAMMB73_Zm00001d050926 [Zea mays]
MAATGAGAMVIPLSLALSTSKIIAESVPGMGIDLADSELDGIGSFAGNRSGPSSVSSSSYKSPILKKARIESSKIVVCYAKEYFCEVISANKDDLC